MSNRFKLIIFSNDLIHYSPTFLEGILNFFDNKIANAESFNSETKGFKANLWGVTDVKYYLFRLEKLFA